MKFSIITPTENRPSFLLNLQNLIYNQTEKDWEWLIYDSSLKPISLKKDWRIHYFHDPNLVTIGEKRNRLIGAAKGEWIIHFDDDDYYAPNYLEMMGKNLREVDFFHLHSWFSYDLKTKHYYYWDTQIQGPSHFILDSLTGMRTREVDFGKHLESTEKSIQDKGQKGYGFSFGYRKQIAPPFEDIDIGEDYLFQTLLIQKGAKIGSAADQKGLTVHLLHNSNTARVYPQFRIPSFLVQSLLANFILTLENLSS